MGLFSLLSRPKQSHEQQLERLVTDIHATNKHLARLSLSQRRQRATFTFYSIIFALVYSAVVLILKHYRTNPVFVSLIPLLIFLIISGRRVIDIIYRRRIDRDQSKLQSLRDQQANKLEEIKLATNFYETKALLTRFGDDDPAEANHDEAAQLHQQQTYLQLLLQAEQQKKQQEYEASAGHKLKQQQQQQQEQQQGQQQSNIEGENNESEKNSTWSSRMMNFILGEDELSSQKRFALICDNCFAHNGLARPGTTHPDTVKYCCPICGFWNGVDDLGQAIFADNAFETELEELEDRVPGTNSDTDSDYLTQPTGSTIEDLSDEKNTVRSRKSCTTAEPLSSVNEVTAGTTTGTTSGNN
ncbi:hypothetical protein NADFUDRAFT_83851 [Nadsonia fulvescens var. elongata DSM 6958]|uniref:Endoplasmic reticulum junction formation protein lunapark n=1 Tax=Nadsonia fulvescens var. elongata DSM 6958 TaxID=857566 RepID=A0A1E3PHC0_9ASCO|nr:hypothetical protein NADFUDRAFT_83851 [Nadsonia fulvescens var. elongata DSM 6958]